MPVAYHGCRSLEKEPSMRTLIIDDEENIRRITVVMLEAAKTFGHQPEHMPRKKKEKLRDPDVQDG